MRTLQHLGMILAVVILIYWIGALLTMPVKTDTPRTRALLLFALVTHFLAACAVASAMQP